MLKYTMTKVYFATLAITHTSSLPHGFATWTPNNNVFVQSNVSTKSTKVGAPCVEVKKSFSAFIRKFAP